MKEISKGEKESVLVNGDFPLFSVNGLWGGGGGWVVVGGGGRLRHGMLNLLYTHTQTFVLFICGFQGNKISHRCLALSLFH